MVSKEMKLPNNSLERRVIRNAYNLKYLRNCGFSILAVPDGTVSSNPNRKNKSKVQNSQKGNSKWFFGNKTVTPLATLRSHSATLRSERNTNGYTTLLSPRLNFTFGRTLHSCQTLCKIAIGVDKNEI